MASTVDHYDNDLIISTSFQVVSSGIKNIFTNIQVTGRIKKNPQLRERCKRLNIPPGQLLELFKHPLLANSCVVCTCCIFGLNYGLPQLAVAGTLLL